MPLHWSDADEIGFLLNAAYPKTDPLTVRFTELHTMVASLPGFADNPAASTEGALESIQMAWAEARREGEE